MNNIGAFPERDEQKRAQRIEHALSAIIKADDNQTLTQDLIEAGRRALDLHAQVRHGHVPTIEFTLRQAEALVEFFGGYDGEVSVMARPAAWADLPDGLYAYCTEYPDEGCQYLGPTEVDDDLAINGRPTTTPAADVRDATEITEQAAYDMGAKGAPATDRERMLFEAWISGHNWSLNAIWNGHCYIGSSESTSRFCPHAMRTRQLWAAWRDSAALRTTSAAPADAEKGGA